MRRAGLLAATLVCLALAATLVVLAADVWRWGDAIAADDVRYRGAPDASDLWEPGALVPLAAARESLALDDDLAFRRAVRAMRLGKLEDTRSFDTQVLIQRAEAQTQLEAIAASETDPKRRARAMTLAGVILLATPVSTADEQRAALKTAIRHLRTAIALDPENEDAKYNLELLLRRTQAVGARPGRSSGTGRRGGRGAGAAAPGRGF